MNQNTNKSSRWTDQEVEQCKILVSQKGATYAAEILNRRPESVCAKMKQIGHPVPKWIPPNNHPWRIPITIKRRTECKQLKGKNEHPTT
jgi:hypothetical protein